MKTKTPWIYSLWLLYFFNLLMSASAKSRDSTLTFDFYQAVHNQNGNPNSDDILEMGPWANHHYNFHDFEVEKLFTNPQGERKIIADKIDLSRLPLQPNDDIEVEISEKKARFTFPYNITLDLLTEDPTKLFFSKYKTNTFYYPYHPLNSDHFKIRSWPNSFTKNRDVIIAYHPKNKIMVFDGFGVQSDREAPLNDVLDFKFHPITHLNNITVYADNQDTMIDLPNGYQIRLTNVDSDIFFTSTSGTRYPIYKAFFQKNRDTYQHQFPKSRNEAIVLSDHEQWTMPIANTIKTHYVVDFNLSSQTMDLSSFELNETRDIGFSCDHQITTFSFSNNKTIVLLGNTCNDFFTNEFARTLFSHDLDHSEFGVDRISLSNKTLILYATENPYTIYHIPKGQNLLIHVLHFNLKSLLDLSYHPIQSANEIVLEPTDDGHTHLTLPNNVTVLMLGMPWLPIYNEYARAIYEATKNRFEKTPELILKLKEFPPLQQMKLSVNKLTMEILDAQSVCYLPANHSIIFKGAGKCTNFVMNLNESNAFTSPLHLKSNKHDAFLSDETKASKYRFVNASVHYISDKLQKIAPGFMGDSVHFAPNLINDWCTFNLNSVPSRVIVGLINPGINLVPLFNQSIADTNCYQAYFYWLHSQSDKTLNHTVEHQPILRPHKISISLPKIYLQWNDFAIYHFNLKLKYGPSYYHEREYPVKFERQKPLEIYGGYPFELAANGEIVQVIEKPIWLNLDSLKTHFYGSVPNDHPYIAFNLQYFTRKDRELTFVIRHLSYQKTNSMYLQFATWAPYFLAFYLCAATYRCLLNNSGKSKAIQHEIIHQKPQWLKHHEAEFEKLISDTVQRFSQIRSQELQRSSKTEIAYINAGLFFLLRPYPLVKQQVRHCMQNVLATLDVDMTHLSTQQRAHLVNQAAFGAWMSLYHHFHHYDKLCSYFNMSEIALLLNDYDVNQQINITSQLSNNLIDVSNNTDLTFTSAEIRKLNQAKEMLRTSFVAQTHFPFPITQQQYTTALTLYFKQHHVIAKEMTPPAPSPSLNQ